MGRSDASTADYARLGYVRGSTGRDSDSWNTPADVVDLARKVLCGIELDPFSSDAANEVVRAERFFTPDDDAFTQQWWAASVWMNPPYSARLARAAIDKFLIELGAGRVQSGIVLTNNATETAWFQRMLRRCDAVLLTSYRISFWNSDGKARSQNTRGQALFYFGARVEDFARVFDGSGTVLRLA